MVVVSPSKLAFRNLDAAIPEHTPGTPELEQDEKRCEADDGADDIRQIRPEKDRDRKLARDVAQRAYYREWPAVRETVFAADQVDQDPWREQGQNRNDVADRRGQVQQRITRHRRERDDRRA